MHLPSFLIGLFTIILLSLLVFYHMYALEMEQFVVDSRADDCCITMTCEFIFVISS